MRRGAFCVVVAGLLAAVASAQTSITIGASRDNTIYSGDVGASNGGGPTMFTGRNGVGWAMRSLIGFNIAGSVPTGSTITRVQLRLVTNFADTAATVSLYRLLQDWGEGTTLPTGGGGGGAVGGPAASGDATWSQNFYTISNWTTAGGTRAAAASASAFKQAVAGSPVVWDSQTSSQLLADAQAMYANPASNFGWELLSSTEGGSTNPLAQRFATRENADASIRPQLTITYTAVPEPSTLAGLAFGAFLLRRARRRRS